MHHVCFITLVCISTLHSVFEPHTKKRQRPSDTIQQRTTMTSLHRGLSYVNTLNCNVVHIRIPPFLKRTYYTPWTEVKRNTFANYILIAVRQWKISLDLGVSTWEKRFVSDVAGNLVITEMIIIRPTTLLLTLSNSHTLTHSHASCPNAFQQLSEATTMPHQSANTCHATWRFCYVLDVNRLLIPHQFDENQVAVLQWLVTWQLSMFLAAYWKLKWERLSFDVSSVLSFAIKKTSVSKLRNWPPFTTMQGVPLFIILPQRVLPLLDPLRIILRL